LLILDTKKSQRSPAVWYPVTLILIQRI